MPSMESWAREVESDLAALCDLLKQAPPEAKEMGDHLLSCIASAQTVYQLYQDLADAERQIEGKPDTLTPEQMDETFHRR